MRNIIAIVSFLLFTMLSFSAFADKIIIVGEPVVLEHRGDLYYLPDTYTDTTVSYHYVTVDGNNMVCYPTVQPSLGSATFADINVVIAGDTVHWYCYEYDTTYFEVRP